MSRFRLFLGIIGGASILGAILEIYFPSGNSLLFRLITAFSLKRNLKTLFSTDAGPADIKCIHGIRFIASIWIYFIHKGLFGLGFTPMTNRTEFSEVSTQ